MHRLGLGGWRASLLATVVAPLLLAGACGADPGLPMDAEPLTPTPPPSSDSASPPVVASPHPAEASAHSTGSRQAVNIHDEARDLLEAQLEAFRRLDSVAFSSACADDAFVFGPTADEVLIGRDAVQRAVDSEMVPLRLLRSVTVTTMENRLGAEGDDLAWALDDVEVAVGSATSQKNLLRVASVLARGPEGLRIVGQAWSVLLPNETTMPMVEAKRFPALKPIRQDVDPRAAPVQKLIEELLSGASEPKLEGRRDTFFSGTAEDEIAVGDRAIARLLANFTDGTRKGRIQNTLSGGIFARVHGAGVLAAYQLDVRVTKPPLEMPIRHLVLYLEQNETYRPVLAMSSFGFPGL